MLFWKWCKWCKIYKWTNVFIWWNISLLVKKQGYVAKYIMEVEYITCRSTVTNMVWMKCFIESLNLGKSTKSINIFCADQSVISLIKSETQTYYHFSICTHSNLVDSFHISFLKWLGETSSTILKIVVLKIA